LRSCGKHTRIGHTVLPDGTKVRSCGIATRRWTSKDKVEEGDEAIAGKYRSETVPALMKRFGWKNMMACRS